MMASMSIFIVDFSISLKGTLSVGDTVEKTGLPVSHNDEANCHWRHFQQVVQQHCG